MQTVLCGDIKALILSGGESSRMGRDKSWINYHGKAQVLWLYDLLHSLGLDVSISIRKSTPALYGRRCITDHPDFADHGPLSGVLSALHATPHRGVWLFIGCDYPLFGEAEIKHLLTSRRSDKLATVYAPGERPLPFPALWEAALLEQLHLAFGQGHTSLQRLLEREIDKLHVIRPLETLSLQSADTPDDMKRIQALLLSRLDSQPLA